MSTTLVLSDIGLAPARVGPAEHLADATRIDADTASSIEQFAFQYGRYYDSYLATDLTRQYFWSSGRRGLVSFVRFGRHVVVIGGLLAPAEHRGALLGEFLAFGRAHKYSITFFNNAQPDLSVFREHGFQVTKIGEDAMIDLASCTWKGKHFEWVRRQTNFCQRQGLVCSELDRDRLPSQEWRDVAAELSEVSRQFLASKPQGDRMQYFVSTFDPAKLERQRIFVARADQGAGRIEAFVVCNPSRNGEMWSIEVFRGRTDAVRGAVAFVMHQALQMLQQEGVPLASLCMVPLLRCEKPLEGDSGLLRRLAVLGHKYAGPMYETHGMFHFKSRFRPRFEDRFVCAWPKASVMSIRATICLWAVDQVKPARVLARVLQQFR
jgi:phosphatidylglycerol lysyltransferase